MITKRARMQYQNILFAANKQTLCVAECFNIATGKPEFVLCAQQIVNGVDTYAPLAKLFGANPYAEITPPGAAKYKLI